MGKVRRFLEAAESTEQKLERLTQIVEERPAVQKTRLTVKSGGRLFLVDSQDLPKLKIM